MSIVSSSYEITGDADKHRHVVAKYIDSEGTEYQLNWFVFAGDDVAAQVAAKISSIEQALADAEAQELLQ